MSQTIFEQKKISYINRINEIAKASFNNEQKELAKQILNTSNEHNIDAVFQFVTQRVKTGFVFDAAPEVNHSAVSLVVENKDLFVDSISNPLNYNEHALIIGENYDALKNLLVSYIDPKTGKGMIDLIYIDPPYHTEAAKLDGNDYKEDVEATKFVYRDKFTRDGWLNMMNERLKLAKKLLTDDGLIFVSIDDNEQAYLKVLMDEIFSEINFLMQIAWRRTDNQPNIGKIARVKEYVIVYAKNINSVELGKLPLTDKAKNEYRYSDDKGMFRRAILLDKTRGRHKYPISTKSGKILNGPWMIKQEEFLELDSKGGIYWTTGGDEQPYGKIYLNQSTGQIPSDFWGIEFGTNQRGSQELESLFGFRVFDFPKPVSLIKTIVEIGTRKDSIVLDFFAGSGTTGQAVMELNEEDGGKRKFILVTNNENNIGTSITRERLYRVINGMGSDGESVVWTYSKDMPSLISNKVRVFGIESHHLNIDDFDLARELSTIAITQFKLLNPKYEVTDALNIYYELSALNPFKKVDK